MGWICPICRMPLLPDSGSLVCAGKHSYDVGRRGDVNLLGGRKLAATVGDSADMLAARRRFFERGYYEPLRQELIKIVERFHPRIVADIGCGEGYYLGGIKAAWPQIEIAGTDIAKAGVQMAALAYPQISFAVADTNAFIPLGDESVDLVLNIFAPRNDAEFDRILRPEGHLVVVIPAADHLQQLRDRDNLIAIQEHKTTAVQLALNHFVLSDRSDVRVEMDLTVSEAEDLIGMTPNARHSDRSAAATTAQSLATTAHFEVLIFSKKQLIEN